MFSALADTLTLLATTLFPLFASYKALKSPTSISLAPWLTFYATITTVYLLESTILYPLSYLPLYAWLRLFFHLYLLLPAPEGAARLYYNYIDPFLTEHEHEIEEFIVQAHDKAKTVGLQYVKDAIEWVRVNMLHQEPAPPPAPTSATYIQQLLSRFQGVPAASTPAPSSDMFGSAVSSLLQWAGTSKDKVEIPAQYNQTPADRLAYLQKNMDNLNIVMQAFVREERKISDETNQLTKSRSETDFDKIERDEVGPSSAHHNARQPSGSWLTPWAWGSQPAPDATAMAKKHDPEPEEFHDKAKDKDSAKSTGIEL